ncbi:unnamed protein product [Choristocarpus tenellus]
MSGFALNSLVDKVDNTHAGVEGCGSARPTVVGTDLFQTIAKMLSAMHHQLRSEPKELWEKVEIEARVGTISLRDRMVRATKTMPGSQAVEIDLNRNGLRFVSGVSAPSFSAMRSEIASMYRTTEVPSEEVVFIFESGPLQGQRVIADMEGRNPPYAELKERRHQANFQLPAAEYDLRVQVSVEKEQQPLPGGVPDGWTCRRTKRRSTWRSPPGGEEDSTWLWRADVTLVEETRQGPAGFVVQELRELELELLPGARDYWLRLTDHAELEKMTSKLATHLVTLIHTVNPLQPLSCLSHTPKEDDEGIKQAVVAACMQLRGGRPSKSSPFPGAQPVNMCKRNVHDVQRGSYYIAEKTDGIRYLMMAVQGKGGPTCVLVDRSMAIFKVTGAEFLTQALGVGTVLDGELVLSRSDGKAVFIAFDILRCRENVTLQLLFRSRLQELQDNVICKYEALCKRNDGRLPVPDHLPLVQKRFFKRVQIMDLFRSIRCEGRERVYQDGHLRHHKTDGVIFQPNTPYMIGTDTRLLKWKWADLASVDLKVYPPGMGGSGLRLCTEAANQVEVDLSQIVHLSEHDRSRLVADMGSNISFAEVALDPGSGMWVYMGLRPDKDRPNFITTVVSTMVEVAESLSEEELKYRMMFTKPSEDDWARQESVMRQRAVQWQYNRTRLKETHP